MQIRFSEKKHVLKNGYFSYKLVQMMGSMFIKMLLEQYQIHKKK